MGKDEPGAFRVKVKVKNGPPRKSKGRKGQRARADTPAPHRSLMEALKEVSPQTRGKAAEVAGRRPQRAVDQEARPAPSGPVPRKETSIRDQRPPPAFHGLPHVEVEEAEVEIVHLRGADDRRGGR